MFAVGGFRRASARHPDLTSRCSHGENTGSSPVGVTNKINGLGALLGPRSGSSLQNRCKAVGGFQRMRPDTRALPRRARWLAGLR